jgi:OmpA-OmpF porin, OOP family
MKMPATLLSMILAGIAPAALAADAPVQKVTVRAVAHFGFDQVSIDAADRDRLLAEVAKLGDVTWKTVTATGHTDSIGATDYNERLAARRAEVVKAYLVGKGLDAQMISTTAKAEAAPVASNDTPAGRAKNRRTEIEFEGVRAAR